jgi:hypothetical protein
MIAIGDRVANRWHLQFARRWVVQYNFYVNDRQWGRMFARICPYLTILGARLPQSTSQAGEPDARRRPGASGSRAAIGNLAARSSSTKRTSSSASTEEQVEVGARAVWKSVV